MINSLHTWASSIEHNPLPLYSSRPLGELNHLSYQESKPRVLFIGGMHGDEPEGVYLAQSLLEWLKQSHPMEWQSDWMLITCLNPDGFKRNQRTNAQGVDLNRNFPSKDWLSTAAADRYHPGAKPNSEPEVKALVQLILLTKPVLIIHFHSWQPSLIFSGPANHPAPQYLHLSSGYEVKSDIGYPTPGSLGQWAWKDLNIPVLCTEEKEGTNPTETWNRFGPGLKKIIGCRMPFF